MGIDASVDVDLADHYAFLDKWKDRPDVTSRHGVEDVAGKKAFIANEWRRGKQ